MSVAKRILLVDDDVDLREALAEQLVMIDDFDVFEADDGTSGIDRAKNEMHDIIILDVGLPDMDGREVCRMMRKHGVKCPIVMLTAQDSDADTILGLDAGANDYVLKQSVATDRQRLFAKIDQCLAHSAMELDLAP